MQPREFKGWLENCIRDAKARGMTEEEIYVELLEQVKILTIRMMLKTCSKR